MHFNGGTTPKIAPFPLGDSGPYLIHGPLAHLSAPHTASRSVQPFLHSSRLYPTDRQTDRQTTLHVQQEAAFLHSVHAMRSNNNGRTDRCVCVYEGQQIAVERKT